MITGQAKKDYQREYMRKYMRKARKAQIEGNDTGNIPQIHSEVKNSQKYKALNKRALECLGPQQQWKCAICGNDDRQLVMDHCHTSNVIRGLLCRKCNTLLGLADENVETLKKAIEYLSFYAICKEKKTDKRFIVCPKRYKCLDEEEAQTKSDNQNSTE